MAESPARADRSGRPASRRAGVAVRSARPYRSSNSDAPTATVTVRSAGPVVAPEDAALRRRVQRIARVGRPRPGEEPAAPRELRSAASRPARSRRDDVEGGDDRVAAAGRGPGMPAWWAPSKATIEPVARGAGPGRRRPPVAIPRRAAPPPTRPMTAAAPAPAAVVRNVAARVSPVPGWSRSRRLSGRESEAAGQLGEDLGQLGHARLERLEVFFRDRRNGW